MSSKCIVIKIQCGSGGVSVKKSKKKKGGSKKKKRPAVRKMKVADPVNRAAAAQLKRTAAALQRLRFNNGVLRSAPRL